MIISKKKRWLCYETTFEPRHNTRRWGSACIVFEFTAREKQDDDYEIDPDIAFHRVDKRRKYTLFSDDIGFRIVKQRMAHDVSKL